MTELSNRNTVSFYWSPLALATTLESYFRAVRTEELLQRKLSFCCNCRAALKR